MTFKSSRGYLILWTGQDILFSETKAIVPFAGLLLLALAVSFYADLLREGRKIVPKDWSG